MPEYLIKIDAASLDFIIQVLQNQPLPFVRTAPIIASVGQQVQQQDAERSQPQTGSSP